LICWTTTVGAAVVRSADPNFYWSDGGFMSAAPVDIAATFDGRCGIRQRRGGVPVAEADPARLHRAEAAPNLRQLMIVVDGSIDVGLRREDHHVGAAILGGRCSPTDPVSGARDRGRHATGVSGESCRVRRRYQPPDVAVVEPARGPGQIPTGGKRS